MIPASNYAPGNTPSEKHRKLVFALARDIGLTHDELVELIEYTVGAPGGHLSRLSLGEMRRLIDALKGAKAVQQLVDLRPHVLREQKRSTRDAIVGLAAAHQTFVPIIESAGLEWSAAIREIRFDA